VYVSRDGCRGDVLLVLTFFNVAFEILWHLWLWTKSKASLPAVLGTKYPFYLAAKQANGTSFFYPKAYRVSNKSLENWNDAEFKSYWEDTQKLLDDVNKYMLPTTPFSSILMDYWFWKQQNQSDVWLRGFVTYQLDRLWLSMCHPGPQSHPSVGAGYTWPNRSAITDNNQIDAVFIAIRNNDDGDGAVWHKYRGCPRLFRFNRVAKNSVFPVQMTATVANTAVPAIPVFPLNVALFKPSNLKDAADPTDHLAFFSPTGAVVPGDYSDAPGTDPNEDSDAEGSVAEEARRRGPKRHVSAPRLAPAAARGPKIHLVDEDDGYYYYAGSVAHSAIKIAASQYQILDKDSPLDALVSSLHYCNLCLRGPRPPQPTGTTALLASDEFGSYMTQALQADKLYVLNAPANSISGFTFATADISGGKSNPLVFSTNAVQDAFGLQNGQAPPFGVLTDVKILVFGLDTTVWSAPATATLKQLLGFAGITQLDQSPAVLFLRDISLSIPRCATGKRNAVWFEPLTSYRTTTRLEMDLDQKAIQTLNGYIGVLGGLSITSASVIARRTSTWAPAQAPGNQPGASITSDGSVAFAGEFKVSGTVFDAAIKLHPEQIQLTLVLRTKVDALQTIFDFFKPVLGLEGSNFEFSSWLANTAGATSFEPPYIRRIVVVLDNEPASAGATAQTPGVGSVQIDLETRVNFSGGKSFAIFLMTYTWNKFDGGSTLSCCLWTAPGSLLDATEALMMPDYEAYYSVIPPVTLKPDETWPPYLDLRQIGGFEGIPAEIPTEVTEAVLSIGSAGISFSGSIMAGPPQGAIPLISLGELTLGVSYNFGKTGSLNATLAMKALIRAAPGAKNGSPAQLMGAVTLIGGSWKLNGLVHGLAGSSLYQFFDSDTQGGIGAILDNIVISALAVEYDYQAGGAASSFAIDASILIGSLVLNLDFTCQQSKDSKQSDWHFLAALDTSQIYTGTKLGDLLGHVFGDDIDEELPDFILDVPIEPPNSKDAVGLDVISLPGPNGSTDKALLFTAWLSFDKMTFQAVQYQPATPPGASSRPPPRRVFAMEITGLPSVDIPLIGDLTQPFDEMVLVYVQAKPKEDTSGGLTWAEMNAINGELQNLGKRTLPFRMTKKQENYVDSDVLIPIGAHFILVLKDGKGQPNVVLDYLFYTPTASLSSEARVSSKVVLARRKRRAIFGQLKTRVTIESDAESDDEDDLEDDSDVDDNAQPDPGAAKAPYEKKIGPLTIRNMGFKYSGGKEPTLSIIMDASIALGPIGLDILGFSLDLTFSKGITIFQLPTPSFSLSGLGVAFDQPPVILAGMFLHKHLHQPGPPPVDRDFYEGAVTLSFVPWLFAAAGYYGTTDSDAGSFTSAFVYFILEGPLITLEFAEIDGVTGGFGYNTFLQFPNVKNVQNFPLLQGAAAAGGGGGGTDPNSALANLVDGGWFFPQQGSFWLAAGLSLNALEVLQTSIVVVIQWNPKITLGLFGVATADMPAGKSNDAKIIHVELGIVAVVDFNAGTLKIDGQLAPSSFILDPACHLSGGFALYKWFGGADGGTSDGDFVFTVGGYHRRFQPPPQYPNPPRLQISWSFDSALSITGEAYFAITPNVCMAGGRLDASLSLGPLRAWFDAWADALINYKPFHFTAESGLSVGVSFTLDLWICTIHINVEIGADLYLHGPPTGGTVHVNFWIFGFDIDFGRQESGDAAALLLEEFYKLALQSDISKTSLMAAAKGRAIDVGGKRKLSAPARGRVHEIFDDDGDENEDEAVPAADDDASPPPHVYTCNEGLIPSGDAESTPSSDHKPWKVRGAVFQFTVGCKFAIDSATVITALLDPNAPRPAPLPVPGNGQPIYARPMRLTQKLTSTLTITITPIATSRRSRAEDDPPIPGSAPRWDVGVPVIKSVPKAVWGNCTSLFLFFFLFIFLTSGCLLSLPFLAF